MKYQSGGAFLTWSSQLAQLFRTFCNPYTRALRTFLYLNQPRFRLTTSVHTQPNPRPYTHTHTPSPTTTFAKMVRFSLAKPMSEEENSMFMKHLPKSYDSSSDESHEDSKSTSRVERRKQMVLRRMSKTRRGLRRATNWSYEQQWRKERKTMSFDPIIIPVVDDFLHSVLCDCACCPCKCMR